MRRLLLLAGLIYLGFGAENDFKRNDYGGSTAGQVSGWSEWSSSSASVPSTTPCLPYTVTSTIQIPCLPNETVTVEKTKTLPGLPPVTLTSTIETTKTLPGPPAGTVTSISTLERTTTIPGGSVCCGGVTTYINNYYGNKTTTVFSTSTVTSCGTSPLPTPCNGPINIDALLIALKVYFNTSFIEELNATLIESLSISLFQNLNESLTISLNESLSNTLNETIYDSFNEVISIEIDDSIHKAIHNEFTSTAFFDFEEQLTKNIENSINTTLNVFYDLEDNITNTISSSIDKSVHNSINGVFLTDIESSVDNSLRRYIDNEFITNFDLSTENSIKKIFNQEILANISEVIYGALHNTTYNTNITLNESSLEYMNKSITDVVFGYMHNQFTDRRSSFYADMSQITSSYAYNSSPWYAIAILTLLIIFGILTLAGLLWLIFKNHKHRKKMGNCPECGASFDQCTCGT